MVPWFISPWEAARVYMEAQRLTAQQMFGFALRTIQPKEELPEERPLGEEKVFVPSTIRFGSEQGRMTSSADHLLTSPKQSKPVKKTTVAARSHTQTTKKAAKTRKQKSRAGRGRR